MKKFLVILMLSGIWPGIYGQVENVPLDHHIYKFLKKMEVKQVIGDIHGYNPLMSRKEAKSYIDEILSKKEELSSTEKKIALKYSMEFSDVNGSFSGIESVWGSNEDIDLNTKSLTSDKYSYFYYYKDSLFNFIIEPTLGYERTWELKPGGGFNNYYLSDLFLRGSVGQHVGYNLRFDFILFDGSGSLPTLTKPFLRHNIKYLNNEERFRSANDAFGYIRTEFEPFNKTSVSLQFGTQQYTMGHYYGSSLILSELAPNMDFFKFDFRYGVLTLSSFHGSTVGAYSTGLVTNYTKYLAAHSLHLNFPGVINIGVGETIVYGKRGIELAYLTPVNFYKFAEMNMQDRDNGLIYLEFQTDFIKNLEFQGTFMMDETVLIFSPTTFENKYALQVGGYWYSPLGINDLSVVTEYTFLRPYVYTHRLEQNTYTGFDVPLGHRAGPNSDEIMLKLDYNFSERFNANIEYRYVREGNNEYDEEGNLVLNVGGDMFYPHELYNDGTDEAPFLRGLRVNTNIVKFSAEYELLRDLRIYGTWYYRIEDHVTENYSAEASYIHTGFEYGL